MINQFRKKPIKRNPTKFSKRIFKKYWSHKYIDYNIYDRYAGLINQSTKRHRRKYPTYGYRFIDVDEKFETLSCEPDLDHSKIIKCIRLRRNGFNKGKFIVEINYLGHGSLAIIDFDKKRIEYLNSWYEKNYTDDIEKIFLCIPETVDMEFVVLNKYILQVGEPNCFIWGWLYLHYHLTGGIDSQKTLEYLMDIPPEDRQNVAYKYYFGESITGI